MKWFDAKLKQRQTMPYNAYHYKKVILRNLNEYDQLAKQQIASSSAKVDKDMLRDIRRDFKKYKKEFVHSKPQRMRKVNEAFYFLVSQKNQRLSDHLESFDKKTWNSNEAECLAKRDARILNIAKTIDRYQKELSDGMKQVKDPVSKNLLRKQFLLSEAYKKECRVRMKDLEKTLVRKIKGAKGLGLGLQWKSED